MFGSIGFPELMVIFIIALLVFGPKKLPEVGRSIGKAMREFRKTTDEIKGRIEDEIQADEFRNIKKDFDDVRNTRFDISNPDTSKSEDKNGEQKQKEPPKTEKNKSSGPSSGSAEDIYGKFDNHGEGEKNS